MFQLAFDARSFAPFAFSPVAFAIQALVEEIQAERVNGGGGRGSRQPLRSAPARPQALPSRREVSEDEVRAQWELLELRRDAQRQADAEREQARSEPPRAITREPAASPAPPAPVITSESAAAAAAAAASRLDDEAEALVLLLAEA